MSDQKFRLFFPDGDWFRDEDGHTEFTARRADAIDAALDGHVTLERRPWPPEPIIVDCVYCGHCAPVSEMRILDRPQGGMACRAIDACDARDAARDPGGIYPEET